MPYTNVLRCRGSSCVHVLGRPLQEKGPQEHFLDLLLSNEPGVGKLQYSQERSIYRVFVVFDESITAGYPAEQPRVSSPLPLCILLFLFLCLPASCRPGPP